MSGENNYEVHVALTGLNEALSQLQSFETQISEMGRKSGHVDTSALQEIAATRAQLLSIRGEMAATLAATRDDLANGIQPLKGLTGIVTDGVRASLVAMNQLGEGLKKSLDLKTAFNPSDLSAVTNSIRNSIVTGGQQGLKELRAEFNAFGKEMGLSPGLVGPVTNGRGANLAFDRTVNSVPPVDFSQSQASKSAQREAEQALRDLAQSARGAERMVTVYRGSHEPLDLDRVNGEGLNVTQDRSYAEEYGGKKYLYQTQVPESKFERSDFTDEVSQHTRLTRDELAKYPLQPIVAPSENGVTEKIAQVEEQRLAVEESTLEAARREERAKQEAADKAARIVASGAYNLDEYDSRTPATGGHGSNGSGGNGSGGGPHVPEGDFPGMFPDEGPGIPSPQEGALLVEQNRASRFSRARGAGFILPDYAGPGQSPAFDLVPASYAKGQLVRPEYLKRVTDPVESQQILGDPTTEAGRLAQQKQLGASIARLIQAQNQEAVALLEDANILKKQNADFSRAENGTFIRRKGTFAGTPVVPEDLTYNQDIAAARQAAATTANKEAAAKKRADKLDNTSLASTFLGGFTSHGFENPGQGVLPALVGTAGVLGRYAVDGAAFGAVTLAIKGAVEETEAYQKALIELNEATDVAHTGQINLNGAFTEGAKYGLDQATAIELGTAGIRNYSDEIQNGANATDIFTESVKQAGINAVITGQKAAEAQKQLLAITNEFGTGSQGQAGVTDAVFNASKRFNADPAEIQKSLVENGDLAQVAGFDTDRLAATSAAIIGQGASPAGLSRLLARGGNAQFQGALSSLNVTNTGNVADELDKASEAYGKLSNAQKAAFAEQSGGARSAEVLIALLKSQADVNKSVTESYTEGGKAAQAALDIQNTAAGQIKQFFTELKNLGGDLGKSGVADILGLLFEIIKTGVGAVDTLVAGFNKFTSLAGPFKDILITAGELFVVLKAIAGLSEAKTIIGGFGVLGQKIRNKSGGAEDAAIPTAAKDAAGEIKGAGSSLAASIEEAAAKIRTAAGIAATEVEGGGTEIRAAETKVAGAVAKGGDAIVEGEAKAGAKAAAGGDLIVEGEATAGGEAAAGGLLGGARGLLGKLGTRLGFSGAALEGGALAGGIAAGVGADVLFTYKAGKNYQDQLDAREKARAVGASGDGSSAALADSAKKASSAAQAASASSAGLLGTVMNAISVGEGYGGTGGDARYAKNTGAELAREADRQRAAEKAFNDSIGKAGNFNLNAPDFSKGISDLQSQGQSYTEIGQNEMAFLDAYLQRQNAGKGYLAVGQGGILANKIADTTTSNLRGFAEDTKGRGADSGYSVGTLAASEKIANLGKKQQAAVNDAVQKSTDDFIKANSLEGQDLSKLPRGELTKLKQQNIEALKESLKKQGLNSQDIKALERDGVLNAQAGSGIGLNAFNINDKSGVALTPAQVTDAIKNSSAVAKGIGTAAGVNEALDGGVNADQQGADLKAQQLSLQSLRDKLKASNPDADLSVLDEELRQVKLDLANETGAQAKAMANYAASLLSPLDVEGQLKAQLDGLREAAKSDKGQALRDDLGQIAQKQYEQQTRANVLSPTASQALNLDVRSTTSASQLALSQAQRDLDNAKAQNADQTTLDQKQQAVRQAQLAYNQAVTADANATEAANVVLGDKVGELKAKYDGLIAQARNQTGGQAAQTLRDAQQTLIDEANAQADILGKVAASNLDPRNKIGSLQQQLNALQSKVFAPGDTGGRADNVTQQKALQQQIIDAQNAQAAALANASFDPRNAVGLARQAVKNAKRNLDAQLPGTQAYADALIAFRQAQISYTQAVNAVANAAEESRVFSGDSLGEAKSKLDAANRGLRATLKGTTAYYEALKAQRDAQVALAAEQDKYREVLRELSEDETNPIVQANDALKAAQDKLARDIRLKAPKNVIAQDKLDVREAANTAAATKFSTDLSTAQANFELGRNAQFANEQGRLTYRQYMSYLTSERDRLLSIKNRSYEQQQELNQVDQAILAAQSQLQGQFNLGDIKIPTVYEVRRSLQENPFLNPDKLTDMAKSIAAGSTSSNAGINPAAVQAAGTVANATTSTSASSFNFQQGFDSVVAAVDRLHATLAKTATSTTTVAHAAPNTRALKTLLGAAAGGTRTTRGRK